MSWASSTVQINFQINQCWACMARSPANTPEGILAWAFALTTSVFQSQMPETSQLCTNTWDFRNILKNVWKNYFLIIKKKKKGKLRLPHHPCSSQSIPTNACKNKTGPVFWTIFSLCIFFSPVNKQHSTESLKMWLT